MSKDMTPELEQAAQSSEIQTRMLVTIYADTEPFRFVANDNVDLVMPNGNVYYAAEITRGEIKTTLEGDKEQVSLKMSNRNAAWAGYFANNGSKMNGCKCVLQEVFLDHLGEPVWLFEGILNKLRMTISEFHCTVERDTVDYSQDAPAMDYGPTCQYTYKDERCRCTSSLGPCDQTLTSCDERGNVTRFGGHPSIPREMVIRS